VSATSSEPSLRLLVRPLAYLTSTSTSNSSSTHQCNYLYTPSRSVCRPGCGVSEILGV